MKKIYICGDSFGCPDLGWTIKPWPQLLGNKLGFEYQIINLSISCASNFLIRIQVDQAIENRANFVILLATTCTREQGQVHQIKNPHLSIYDRFVKIGQDDPARDTRDLACYSLRSLDDTCVFDREHIHAIKDYNSRIFNLDLAIQQNQYIIESSLYTLRQNCIPFIFDQGGFENPMFGDVRKTDYFFEFDNNRSKINQWTLSTQLPKSKLPHIHIMDPVVHAQIADYFYQMIVAFFQKNL